MQVKNTAEIVTSYPKKALWPLAVAAWVQHGATTATFALNQDRKPIDSFVPVDLDTSRCSNRLVRAFRYINVIVKKHTVCNYAAE